MFDFNCINCGSDDFDLVKGIYTCKYCGTTYRYTKEFGYVEFNSEDALLIVSVRFRRGYQTYDYIYDLPEDVRVGDLVVVLNYNGNPITVVVTDITVMRVEELPMPINGYKRVIKKFERSQQTPPPVHKSVGICGTPFINAKNKGKINSEPPVKPRSIVFQRSKMDDIIENGCSLLWFAFYIGLPLYYFFK